jgi:hypothetical protein
MLTVFLSISFIVSSWNKLMRFLQISQSGLIFVAFYFLCILLIGPIRYRLCPWLAYPIRVLSHKTSINLITLFCKLDHFLSISHICWSQTNKKFFAKKVLWNRLLVQCKAQCIRFICKLCKKMKCLNWMQTFKKITPQHWAEQHLVEHLDNGWWLWIVLILFTFELRSFCQ